MTGQSIRVESLEAWLQTDVPARQLAVQQLRDRIVISDTSIQAWVEVQPQPAAGHGALAGIPFGAKDIIETANLPTEYGSPLYKGRRGTADAAIIRQLRGAGAILLGKTHTAAFAYFTPAVTRNPRNLDHTPGGSSSGSAAAVAAGMIPFALGTQTLGSVLRPASYCGITGFKPTYGLFSMDGVLPMARSLDTLGFFTATARDMLALWRALGQPAAPQADVTFGVPDPLPNVDPAMADAFQAALATLRVERLPIGSMLDRLAKETRVVMFYEGARFHEPRYRQFGDQLQDLAALVREGLEISDTRYQEALGFIVESKQQIAAAFQTTPVILSPAATGPAPRGLSSTGDPRMNAPWTALGVPAISIPMPVAGLPLGLQLTAARGEDVRVLHTAVRIAGLLEGV
jgi:amidase